MRPMFATPGCLPEGPEWCYEVKWAGVRVLADINGGTLRLTSHTERDLTGRFPEFRALAHRIGDALLDGEVIVLDGGVPSRLALAARLRSTDPRRTRRTPRTRSAVFLVSDVLRLYGVSLLHRSPQDRRSTLERVGVDAADGVTLSPVYDDGAALLSATGRQRLDGVVAKRFDAPYRPGVRDPSWVQVSHR